MVKDRHSHQTLPTMQWVMEGKYCNIQAYKGVMSIMLDIMYKNNH